MRFPNFRSRRQVAVGASAVVAVALLLAVFGVGQGGGSAAGLTVAVPSPVGVPFGGVPFAGSRSPVSADTSSDVSAVARVLPDRVADEGSPSAAAVLPVPVPIAPASAEEVAVPAASPAAMPSATAPVATVPAATPTPVVVSVDPCSIEAMQAFVAGMLAPFAIPAPVVALGSKSFYQPGVGVTLEPCADRSVVAHELGHFVIDRANGSFSAHVADVTANFCPGGAGSDGRCVTGWIRGNEIYPGIEHAAHCVGHVLVGYTVYTKCPDPALLALARERVRQAA
jgi:hypothetical protein